jgi:hypothetical protein
MSNQERLGFRGPRGCQGGNPRAVLYLLKGTDGGDRRDIVREIVEIVTEVARGLSPGGQDPFEDEFPGG